jgi:hypothetical protein
MPFIRKCMELRIIMLSKINQKDNSVFCHLDNVDFFLKDMKVKRGTIWKKEKDKWEATGCGGKKR